MIIRLRGADFSDNNIGKVQFKRELTPETLNILSKYSRTITEEQQFAFQDFIQGLKDSGIWSKISVMYMPILSNTLDECMINLKNLSQCVIPTNKSIYNVENGWLKLTKVDGQLDVSDTVQLKINGSNMNVHFLAYMNASVEYIDGHTIITNKANTSDTGTFYTTIGRTYNANYRIGTTTKNSLAPIKHKGLLGFSSGTDTFLSFEDTVKPIAGVVANDNTITDLTCYINRRETSWATPVNIDWSIMSTGTAFSFDEGQKYKQLVDLLVSKFN